MWPINNLDRFGREIIIIENLHLKNSLVLLFNSLYCIFDNIKIHDN